MEEDKSSNEDPPTREELRRARRAELWRRSQRVAEVRRRRSVGCASRGRASSRGEESRTAGFKGEASSALGRIVAGLKFIPEEPVPLGNDAFWDEMLCPICEAVSEGGDGLLPVVDKQVPNNHVLLSAINKQVSLEDQALDEFRVECHLQFLLDWTHATIKKELLKR
jgi:hypothetical protein